VTISIGYLGELIQSYFATRGGIPDLEISYLRETEPLGTAGALGFLRECGEELLVINGDILTTFDFAELIAFHRRERPTLTIAVHPQTITVDLGVIEIGPDSEVLRYTEKPSFEYQCSMGINVYSAAAVRAIAPGEPLDFPDLARRLMACGERVLAHRSDCYWMDIGRRDDYERAQDDFAALRHRLLPDEAAPVASDR
jgi:NDP-sugar pyrophosphorylase family protein